MVRDSTLTWKRPETDTGPFIGSLRFSAGDSRDVAKMRIHRKSELLIGARRFSVTMSHLKSVVRFYNEFTPGRIPDPIVRVYEKDEVKEHMRNYDGFFYPKEPDTINMNREVFDGARDGKTGSHELAHLTRFRHVSEWIYSESNGSCALEESCANFAQNAWIHRNVPGFNIFWGLRHSYIQPDSPLELQFNGIAVARSLLSEVRNIRGRRGALGTSILDDAILKVVYSLPDEHKYPHHVVAAGLGLILFTVNYFNFRNTVWQALNDDVETLKEYLLESILGNCANLDGLVDIAERRSLDMVRRIV